MDRQDKDDKLMTYGGFSNEASAASSWMSAMRHGDFARAWEISDMVLRRRVGFGESSWHLPRHLQHVWTGAPFSGRRVLVRCYHGLGDTIQFIRFAAPLREIARDVTVWAQPSLLPLVATAPGVDRVLALHNGIPQADYDVDVEIMELPHVLRTELASIPRTAPYLFPPASPAVSAANRERLRVGIVWQAGDWDASRSAPAALLDRLMELPGIELLSLQRGSAQAEARKRQLPDIGRESIVETAARVRRLDLVISVDTMMAHLAGALGVSTWALLSAECDWRWMEGRDDCPWYPTMRLFRQRNSGDWSGVIDAVTRALSAVAPSSKSLQLQPLACRAGILDLRSHRLLARNIC
jgi:hypothetical protein